MDQLEPAELKRKFKDVLRAYWRQHKSNHEGEDTERSEVATKIAQSIFQLYWEKPIYEPLRRDKSEILNYFIKHIQLSKTREGQSNNPGLRSALAFGSSSKNYDRSTDVDRMVQGVEKLASTDADLMPITYLKEQQNIFQNLQKLKEKTLTQSKSIVNQPLELEYKKFLQWIDRNVSKSEIANTLLVDGIGSNLNSEKICKEIQNSLYDQYKIEPISVEVVESFKPTSLVLKILVSKDECIKLSGNFLKIPSVAQSLKLYRINDSNLKFKATNLELDSTVKKKLKYVEPENEVFRQSSLEPNSYVVDCILQQRWVNNMVQYQLRLRGEKQTIKVWIFDEHIYSEFESNRRNASLFKSQFPEDKLSKQFGAIDKILGAKLVDGQLMLYLRWSKSNICSFVPNNVVKKIAPLQLLEFYEERISVFDPKTTEKTVSDNSVADIGNNENCMQVIEN